MVCPLPGNEQEEEKATTDYTDSGITQIQKAGFSVFFSILLQSV